MMSKHSHFIGPDDNIYKVAIVGYFFLSTMFIGVSAKTAFLVPPNVFGPLFVTKIALTEKWIFRIYVVFLIFIRSKQAKRLWCFFWRKDNTEKHSTVKNKKHRSTPTNNIQKQNWKNTFWTNVAPKKTRNAAKTEFLFTSRNQNNKHNLTHKNKQIRNKKQTKQENKNRQRNKEGSRPEQKNITNHIGNKYRKKKQFCTLATKPKTQKRRTTKQLKLEQKHDNTLTPHNQPFKTKQNMQHDI